MSLRGGVGHPCLQRFILAVVGLAFLLAGATAPAGTVNLTSQTRFVDVTTAGAVGVSLPPEEQRVDAPDFGPFDRSVNLTFLSQAIEQTVAQQSTLTLTPDGLGAVFDAHGSLTHSSDTITLQGTSHFEVSFDVTRAARYFLTYNGRQGDPADPQLDHFVPGTFDGPSAPGTLAGDPLTTNFFTTLTYRGTLQPGSYTLLAQSSAIDSASFDLHLAVGSAAVPLPAAAWAALTALPVLIVAMRLRRRGGRC